VRLHLLDETNVEEAMRWPERFRAGRTEALETFGGTLELDLLPYAVTRIDTWRGTETD
jgi:hypothetical protein